MANKTKLELTWIGKENRPLVEPRILLEDQEKSYHAKQRVNDNDTFDNRLIFGDNLLALKALEQEYAGKIKCAAIDPPYNTGSAFTHYDDGIEHSIWLSLIRDRLELIRTLLSGDGSTWITIDDNEAHYLKVLCDEVFGRANFLANVIWQKRFAPNSTAQFISDSHDHVLVFAKDKSRWKRNLLPRDEKHNKSYRNPDNDPRGPWTSGDMSARNPYSIGIYPITTPSGRVISGPPKGMFWRVSKAKLQELDKDNRIWWGDAGNNVPRIKRFLSEVMDGIVPQTIWLHDEVGNTQDAKKEVMAVVENDAEVFQTPKPELLLHRILTIATNPGDLVLDSFAGSGTTGAVAHKMGRRWIMVELGEHCHTHIIPRLKKVIDGEDPGGITESVRWKGGGGFRYYRLAPSMLEKDEHENYIISRQYNAPMLAEAMCKQMGFTFSPSDTIYWQHGRSSEADFVFVTTQTLSRQQLSALSAEVGEHRSLMICCSALRTKAKPFHNLTLVKIPNAVLARCEWGRDDYSLNVANLPMMEEPPEDEAGNAAVRPAKTGKRKRRAKSQIALFAGEGQ